MVLALVDSLRQLPFGLDGVVIIVRKSKGLA